ncbi:DUF7507 domain-containing protein [Oricola nitratireducens]|uniref:DUF7507 domain-containing protein n=1 Tax=Oricola nitratireducens TaxID=2775868 RepID=UPI00186858AA|nr:DUF11 domain-containing protein [Oricola nitratireducens]
MPTFKRRPKRAFRTAALLCAALAFGLAGPASAAITSSAVATGTYAGETVRSAPADMTLDVEKGSPALALSTEATVNDDDGTPNISAGDTVEFTIEVQNTGDVGLTGVAMAVELTQRQETFSPAEPPRLVGGDETNPGILDRGETWRYSARYVLALANLEARDPITAAVVASGEGIGIAVTGRSRATAVLPPLQGIAPRLISLSHTPSASAAGKGDTVDYTITISNRSDRELDTRLAGILSDGIVLAADSAVIDGALAHPLVDGSALDFGDIAVAAGASATVTYSARVSAEPVRGFHVNSAMIADPATGIALIPPANATVQTGRGPQTGCTGISVRVFHDDNRDGEREADEAGISGVRVSTDDAGPFTTDPSGRFHSPCVAVSRLAGIDLRFRLDEGTLPDGYFVTTQNPLSIRVERGESGAVSFGAAAARIVRIDLNEAAFRRNTVTPDAEMTAGITRLISVLGREPSILRLTYYAHREDTDLSERRLEAVRKTILSYWTASDHDYDLKIEARVVQSDG